MIRDGILYKHERAVIVHGIGGIGKTALIQHMASRLQKHFDGVCVFDCRGGALGTGIACSLLHLKEQAVPVPYQLASWATPANRYRFLLASKYFPNIFNDIL